MSLKLLNKTSAGTTDTIQTLTTPPGASGGAGPQNITIHTIHAGVSVVATPGLVTLTVLTTTQGGGGNVILFQRRNTALANMVIEFDLNFDEGWLFPVNTGAQFQVRLQAPAGSVAADINTSYSFTTDGW